MMMPPTTATLFLFLLSALLPSVLHAAEPVVAPWPAVQLSTPPTTAPVIITTASFPVLPYGADGQTPPWIVPVAGNHALEGEHPGITRAVIAIHDVSRDAAGILGPLTALAGAENDRIIILAPQFLLPTDVKPTTSGTPPPEFDRAVWAPGGWEDGADSIAKPPRKGVSAFTAIDLLLLYLNDKKSFPDLRDIVLTGAGTGGDFVQRYAAAGQAADLPDLLPLHVLVANAASYLYFTPLRPQAARPGFSTPSASQCPMYDGWKYGLQNLNPYARRKGANAIRLSYAARRVTYLTGEKIATTDLFPDFTCAALLQGADRAARAMHYDMYLATIFGEAAASHHFVTIPGAGYDAAALLGSPCGLSVLFGDGDCGSKPQAEKIIPAENQR